MLKIECSGLTLQEGKELEAALKDLNCVGEIKREIELPKYENRSGLGFMLPPHFWLLIGTVGGGAATIAYASAKEFAKAVSKEVGEEVGKAIKAYVERRYSGKSASEVKVTLYDADGNLIREFRKKR